MAAAAVAHPTSASKAAAMSSRRDPGSAAKAQQPQQPQDDNTGASKSSGGAADLMQPAQGGDLAEMDQAARRRRRLMLGAIFAGISIALILGFFWRNKTPNKDGEGGTEAASEKLAGAPPQIFDKSGDVVDPVAMPKNETAESLLKLAKDAKAAGLLIQGVTQCGWTRKQREMFGNASSPARKVIESIYIECRDRSMCPNIRGYPTWVRGDQQFPGFKDPAKIRELIKEVGPAPVQPMLQEASEPVADNIPDVKAQAPSATNPAEIKAQANADAALAKVVGAVRQGQAAAAAQAQGAGAAQLQKGDKVENVRGVSAYPPLAPPVMPGTAPFQLNESMASNQMRQGNVPRLAVENPDPVAALANQMAATFQQIAADQARDPNSGQFSNAQLPQSATITTGDAFADKRIYTEIN